MMRSITSCSVLVLLLAVIPLTARVETAAQAPSEAENNAALGFELSPVVEGALRFYGSVNSYVERSRVLVPPDLARVLGKKYMNMKVWFERPNKLKVRTAAYELVSDGEQMQVYVKKLRQYVVKKAPKEFGEEWYSSDPISKLQMPYTLLFLTYAADPYRVKDSSRAVTVLKDCVRRTGLDRTIAKRTCSAVFLPRLDFAPQLGSLLLYIDTETNRLVKLQHRPQPSEEWINLQSVNKVEYNVAIDSKEFVIKAPRGAVKVERFTGL